MSHGEIRDFRKPGVGTRPGPRIMGQNEVTTPLERPNDVPGPETQIDVTVHEDVIREGDGKIRVQKDDDGIEIRVRDGASQADWERTKREN